MGAGIAQKMAMEGFPVVLVDRDDDTVRRSLQAIERSLSEAVDKRVIARERADAALARVRATSELDDVAAAELVVEAVFEDLDVKRALFRRLETICTDAAVLATNTSSFTVAQIAEGTKRPDRILGLHYFYHPAKNRLVEVIPGDLTASHAADAAWRLQVRLGKIPIASRDASGFVVNRYFVPWLVEAVRLYEEGVGTPASIDAAAKDAFGIGMGPFQLMNVTGIPIAYHAATTLGQAFGPLYAPSAGLAAQASADRLWNLSDAPEPERAVLIADRLRAVVFHVAATLVEEGIATVEDTDIGARVGLRWRRGPFESMNDMGTRRAAELAGAFAAKWNAKPAAGLRSRGATGEPFPIQYVRTTVVDGVATLTINRPDALNALNETVVRQLRTAFAAVTDRRDVHGIVIAGSGKAFVAGADIKFFVDCIEANALGRIVEFTRDAQALFRAIEACRRPVVARVHGLALGGGLELALACHRIVASTNAMMGFPETGIGIYPGLGGTQRTTRRVGRGVARWLVFTGQIVTAGEAAAIGLVDRAVPFERLDEAVQQGFGSGKRRRDAEVVVGPEHRALARFFEEHDPEHLRAGTADTEGSEALARAMRLIAAKAPIALRIAAELIDRGASMPLPQALELEVSRVAEIFRTHDAYVGLRSVGGPPPAFAGR
jgi:enoyl-CoA hydratase/3-hydroxyacyl-CoA dehydrogenase